MYEDKGSSFHLDWKSLLIKLVVLLVIIFVVIFVISFFKKDSNNESNFGTNLSAMRDAAKEYFTGSKLPTEKNAKERITLKEMFDQNLLVEFSDENNQACDTKNSYAEIEKIDDESYRLEVSLVCKNESDTIVNTIKRQVTDTENNDLNDDEQNTNNNLNNDSTNITDDNISSNNSNTTNATNPNKKPNSGTSSGSNNTSSNSGSVAVKPDYKPSDNNSSDNNISNVCSFGKKDYDTIYPLAYVVSGDCAVGSLSKYANSANEVYIKEYKKLIMEMYELEKSTGVKIEVEANKPEEIKNIAGTGYVGYQFFFSANSVMAYSKKPIYSYYLDLSGNRIVIVDSRNNL